MQKLRLPITVALARTRTLAKLFSDTAKPFGERSVFDPDEERSLLEKLLVIEISGIGGRRGDKLAMYGIRS